MKLFLTPHLDLTKSRTQYFDFTAISLKTKKKMKCNYKAAFTKEFPNHRQTDSKLYSISYCLSRSLIDPTLEYIENSKF